MFYSTYEAAKKHAHINTIQPIVELHPIYPSESKSNTGSLTVIPRGEDAGSYERGLYNELSKAKSGIYIFYDSRGKALYTGQTKKQNIWREMNLAFNRQRGAQTATLVRHPKISREFTPAHIKVRQPIERLVKLHELAAYFSAYKVTPEMVDDIEAFLVRAFPNDLLNVKMEKFGKAGKTRH